MVETTGTKWNPIIRSIETVGGVTHVSFRTAWAPMNPLLERLHHLTGWTIHNRFEEEQPEFEGDFHAENGVCREDIRTGRGACSYCGMDYPVTELDEAYGECPSCELDRSDYLVTQVVAYDQEDGEDISKQRVVGIFSCHCTEDACMAAAVAQVKSAAPLLGGEVEPDPTWHRA